MRRERTDHVEAPVEVAASEEVATEKMVVVDQREDIMVTVNRASLKP